MNQEEFDRLIDQGMQEFGGTRVPIPPEKESSGPGKVQFIMVKNPRPTEPQTNADSSDTPADEQEE